MLGGVISNNFGIKKQGFGTLEITAPNTYTGTTSIEDGTLLLTGDGTLGDSALIDLFPDTTLDATTTTTILTVGELQTIAGDGLVLGDVALDGTVSPGASAGTLTFDDVLTFYDFSTYTWEIASWDPDAIEGLDYDLLIAGTLDIFALESSPITISIVDDATPDFVEEDRTFIIAQADSILGFDPTLFTIDDSAFKASTGANGTWEIQANGNNLELVYTAQLLSGYALWASQQGFDPGDEIPTADPDGDTVPNGIEFVVGGDPVAGNDTDKLPTVGLDATNLVFTFRQTPESAPQNPFVEYGSDLSGWTTAADGIDGVTITAGTDAPDGTPTVVVTIPRSLATGDKLFARLAFELPSP